MKQILREENVRTCQRVQTELIADPASNVPGRTLSLDVSVHTRSLSKPEDVAFF